MFSSVHADHSEALGKRSTKSTRNATKLFVLVRVISWIVLCKTRNMTLISTHSRSTATIGPRPVNALGGFLKVSRSGFVNIHELLRVAIYQWEPGALNLDHNLVAL